MIEKSTKRKKPEIKHSAEMKRGFPVGASFHFCPFINRIGLTKYNKKWYICFKHKKHNTSMHLE
jgi:hypothetical protein